MLFYLIPIFISTVFIGRLAGIMISICCTAVWLVADLYTGGSRYVYFFTPYWNALARMFFFITVVVSIELGALLKEERTESRIDHLTKIWNRKYFYEFGAKELDRCKRYNHPLALIFLDCDNFKQVNDELGHKTGDKLLCCVADTINQHIRSSDIVARLGGDEFAILLTEAEPNGALNFAQRVSHSLAEIMKRNNWPVTASFGVASFRALPASVDEMVKQADNLMYRAKKAGKDKIRYQLFEITAGGSIAKTV